MSKLINRISISNKDREEIYKALTITKFINPLRVYDSSAGHRVPVTVNLRAVFAVPKVLELIASKFSQIIKKNKIKYVGGYEISGIPLATAISLGSGAWSFSIRKVKHDHGMKSTIAGVIPPKKVKIAVADDGLASGKSMMKSVYNLYKEGYKNIHEYFYFLVTDAAFNKSNINWLRKHNIKLYYLVDYTKYIEWAVKNKYLSPIAGQGALSMIDQLSWKAGNNLWKEFNVAKRRGKVWAEYKIR